MNIKIRDAGGRPPKTFVRDHIINVLSKHPSLTPMEIHEKYMQEIEDNDVQTISSKTITRRLEDMWKKEKVLEREEANNGKLRKLYMYSLRTE